MKKLVVRALINLATKSYKFGFFWLVIVPDIETVNFKVLSRRNQYEIREVEVSTLRSYFFILLMINT